MGISPTHLTYTNCLLTCFQDGRPIEEYMQDFLEISNQVNWTDDVLVKVFRLGLDDPLHQPASAVRPESFAQYLDCVLLLSGSAFTVGEAEDNISTQQPSPAIFLATPPANLSVPATLPESRPTETTRPESRPAEITLPESPVPILIQSPEEINVIDLPDLHFMSTEPEFFHIMSAEPELLHVMSAEPEFLHVMPAETVHAWSAAPEPSSLAKMAASPPKPLPKMATVTPPEPSKPVPEP
ncbi:hypothetical protein PO909_005801 [Leuciscus waleckii]